MQRRDFLLASAAATALTVTGPMSAAAPTFPLLDPWIGPYGGIPDFRKVKVSGFAPSLKQAIALNRAEIAKIAGNKLPPTFANTIAALEDAGRPLSRGSAIFNISASTMDDKAMQDVEKVMNPIFAAFNDEVVQNATLFARIKAVYDKREISGLTPEQQRLVWVLYRRFAQQGAALNEADKKRLAEFNQ